MQMASAKKQIVDLTLRCNGTVSSDEFNAMKKRYEQAELERKKSERKFAGATNKLETAAINKESLMRRVDEYQALNNELKSVGTPRPKNMPGELARLEIDMGNPAGTYARADAIFKRLVAELDTARSTINELRKIAPNDDPYFFGLGSGDSVPLCLRTHTVGQILRNTHMKREEVEDAIKSIFRRKRAIDAARKAAGEPLLTIPQAVLEHCTASAAGDGGQNEIAEYATNLLDGCKRYGATPEIGLLGKIMQGTMAPAVHTKLELHLQRVKTDLMALAWTQTPKGPKPKKGSPSKAEILAFLANGPVVTAPDGTQHPGRSWRSEVEIERLRQALDTDAPQKKGAVNIDALFEEDPHIDEDGEIGETPPPRLFLAELRVQWLQARDEFHRHVAAAIIVEDKEKQGLVNVPQLRTAVKAAEPTRTDEQIDELLREGIVLSGEAYGRAEEELAGTVARRTVLEGPPLKGLLPRGQELPHEECKFHIHEFMLMLRRSDVMRIDMEEITRPGTQPEPEPEPAPETKTGASS